MLLVGSSADAAKFEVCLTNDSRGITEKQF